MSTVANRIMLVHNDINTHVPECYETSVDTAEMMVRDCTSQNPRPGFKQLERLQRRIAKSQDLWAHNFLRYAKHEYLCPEGGKKGLCNCGLEKLKREARVLTDSEI